MDPLGPPPDTPIPAKPLPPILNVQMDNVVSDNKNIYVFCFWSLLVAKCIFREVCHAPLLEECPQHHGHKGDPGVTPGTCGAIGERAQVILVWVRVPRRLERLPPTETRSHEG